MEPRKAKAIQILKEGAIKTLEDGWAVHSQNSKRYYYVDKEYKCNCPDCELNGTKICKHSYAVRYFLGIEKPDGTTEKVRLTYPQAWHAYNEAQNNEVKEFDELLKDLVGNVEEPEYVFGRPRLSKKEQLFCSIQKVYSQLSSRRAYTLFKNAEAKEQIGKAPNYNAVNKFLNNKELTPLLKELVSLSASPLKAVEEKFAADSTGFRTTRFNEYCREKHDTGRKHAFVKLHAVVGCKTNVITACEVTEAEGKGTGDCPLLQPLATETANTGFEIKEFTADKAYNSIVNTNLVHKLGGTAYIPYRSNTVATVRSGNKGKLWRKMFHYFQLNQEEFLAHYHARSNIESTFGAIKAKFGDCLKAKNFESQTNELLCKVIAYNIVVLIHEMHELGIEANFKQLGSNTKQEH